MVACQGHQWTTHRSRRRSTLRNFFSSKACRRWTATHSILWIPLWPTEPHSSTSSSGVRWHTPHGVSHSDASHTGDNWWMRVPWTSAIPDLASQPRAVQCLVVDCVAMDLSIAMHGPGILWPVHAWRRCSQAHDLAASPAAMGKRDPPLQGTWRTLSPWKRSSSWSNWPHVSDSLSYIQGKNLSPWIEQDSGWWSSAIRLRGRRWPLQRELPSRRVQCFGRRRFCRFCPCTARLSRAVDASRPIVSIHSHDSMNQVS